MLNSRVATSQELKPSRMIAISLCRMTILLNGKGLRPGRSSPGRLGPRDSQEGLAMPGIARLSRGRRAMTGGVQTRGSSTPSCAWQAGTIPARRARAAVLCRLSIVVIAAALIAIFASRGTAQLMTESCVDCHVVHAWQDQTEKKKGTAKLYASVLGRTCEGCHANADSNTLSEAGLNRVPIVKNGQEPEVPLAGGNFYYDSGLSHLEKAGGTCTSCHTDVRHHANSAGYRFLGPNIEGLGDPLYEHGEGHNIYKSGDQYCSACHPNFCGSENQRAKGSWIRHPTNTPLPMHGEYRGYVYRKDVPVAYSDPNNPTRSDAHVMCLSCHRPHGTPYSYLLRWNYNSIVAQGGQNDTGCFACHTQKDEGCQDPASDHQGRIDN